MAKKKAQSSGHTVAGCTVKLGGRYYRPGEEIAAAELEKVGAAVLEGMYTRGSLIEELPEADEPAEDGESDSAKGGDEAKK